VPLLEGHRTEVDPIALLSASLCVKPGFICFLSVEQASTFAAAVVYLLEIIVVSAPNLFDFSVELSTWVTQMSALVGLLK
jgi:hypothetical protein